MQTSIRMQKLNVIHNYSCLLIITILFLPTTLVKTQRMNRNVPFFDDTMEQALVEKTDELLGKCIYIANTSNF